MKSFFEKNRLISVIAATAVTGVVVGMLALILPVIFGQPKQNQMEIAEHVTKAVVILAGERGYGSGVIIKSDDSGSYILTNKHVCAIAKIPTLPLSMMEMLGMTIVSEYQAMDVLHKSSKQESKAQIIAVATNADLCLVKTDIANLPSVELADSNARLGQQVFNISNPMFVMNYVTSGFAGDYMFIYNMRYQQVSTPIGPGSSGSGIFNNDGELIGLVSLGSPKLPTLAFMVPFDTIENFLKSNGL